MDGGLWYEMCLVKVDYIGALCHCCCRINGESQLRGLG